MRIDLLYPAKMRLSAAGDEVDEEEDEAAGAMHSEMAGSSSSIWSIALQVATTFPVYALQACIGLPLDVVKKKLEDATEECMRGFHKQE